MVDQKDSIFDENDPGVDLSVSIPDIEVQKLFRLTVTMLENANEIIRTQRKAIGLAKLETEKVKREDALTLSAVQRELNCLAQAIKIQEEPIAKAIFEEQQRLIMSCWSSPDVYEELKDKLAKEVDPLGFLD